MGVGCQRHASTGLFPGRRPVAHFHRRLGGLQGLSERVRKISPVPGFQPQTVQPVASRYYYYAIPTHNLYVNSVINCIVTILSLLLQHNTGSRQTYLVRPPNLIFPCVEVMFWERFSRL